MLENVPTIELEDDNADDVNIALHEANIALKSPVKRKVKLTFY